MAQRLASRVLLVGWDAADWRTITPLLDAGEMPALQSLIDRGVMGNLATLDPPFSPMLWTSIATGHTADRHGILHFVQPRADGRGVRPVLGSTRKTKAVWNILSQEGLHSNVIGWWPSHPAEPIRGAMVSDWYQRVTTPVHEAWPLAPGAVHPPELAETLARFRVHPAELTADHLLPFLPRLGEIDQEADRRPLVVAKILADATCIQAAATYLMETTNWDFTAVYFDAIDHFGHGFMKYHPPQMAGISDEDFERYQHVVREGYRFHDRMLARLLELAGDDTTVLLVSDHGFHSDHLRPGAIPDIPAGPAVEHRTFGVFTMAGPGVKRDERLYGASLLNIAPTVLTLFGLPTGRDMAAPPLIQAFEETPAVEFVDSWDDIAGDAGQHETTSRQDPWAEAEALQQLVDLGYIEPADDDPAEAARSARVEGAFNLGRVFLSTGRPEQSLAPFEEAHADARKHKAYKGMWLAHAYFSAGRHADAERLARTIVEGEAVFETPLRLLLADIYLATDRAEDALDTLGTMPEAGHPEVHLRLGRARLLLGQPGEADAHYVAALEIDPDNARAWHGRATTAIAQKRYEEAADHALAAVARIYHFPDAHFHLGVALRRLGWVDRAEQAFRIAVRQRPRFALAHRWLARLYAEDLKDPAKAAHHADAYRRLQEQVKT